MKRIRNISAIAIASTGLMTGSAYSQEFDVTEATIDDIHAALEAEDATCVEIVQGYLDRIDAYNEEINTVMNVNPEALAEAEALDAAYAENGLTGSLHCSTVLVKDQVEAIGMPTTYGSAIFEEFYSDRDATIVSKMKDEGAIILGKANLGEFASAYVGSAYGYIPNVYDVTRNPSGSSGGSGNAAAASLSTITIGEDTGGSIQGPAAHTNTVGLRPTLGLISTYGMMPASPSRDTLGPITRTVRDSAIATNVLAGYDPNDKTTASTVGNVPESYVGYLDETSLQGARIGVIREPMDDDAEPDSEDYASVRSVVDAAVRDMEELGAIIVDPVEIPNLVELLQQSSSSAETEEAVDSYLAELSEPPVSSFQEIAVSDMVTPRRQNGLIDGLNLTTDGIEHLASLAAREELRTEVLQVMAENDLDAFVFATFDHSPALIPDGVLEGEPDEYGKGSNRSLSAYTGFPVLTVPAGFSNETHPVGINILGRPFSEGPLFGYGYAYEQATGHRMQPEITPALN